MNIEYKYKVGDKIDFEGIIDIVMCSGYKKRPQYWVRTEDGSLKIVDEGWLDARVNRFLSDKKKSDVYIPATPRELKTDFDCGSWEVINAINSCAHPETPEEFKVGDRVQIIDPDNTKPTHLGQEGIIVDIFADSRYRVQFIDDERWFYHPKYLRKLPDLIRFDNPMDRQVGGEHYKMPIQPVEFIERNGLGFCVGNCIKYLCRYKKKNGREDLEKAKHYIDLLIELEYPEDEKD